MISKEVVFLAENSEQLDPGRVSAVLIQKASAYIADIRLEVAGRRANAKSLLGVMSLALDRGTEVNVTCEGPDEDEALETIVSYLEEPEID